MLPAAQDQKYPLRSRRRSCKCAPVSSHIQNTLNIIFRRRHHITVGQTDFPSLVLQSPVGKNSASEQKFFSRINWAISRFPPLILSSHCSKSSPSWQYLFSRYPSPTGYPAPTILRSSCFSFFLLQIVSIVKRIAVHAVNRNTLMLPHETLESNVTFGV